MVMHTSNVESKQRGIGWLIGETNWWVSLVDIPKDFCPAELQLHVWRLHLGEIKIKNFTNFR